MTLILAIYCYDRDLRLFILISGTSTDLVPQLLGMFDELVRRGTSCTNHGSLQSCGIPAALQKRLSLVSRSRRSSLLNPLYVTESLPASSISQDITKESGSMEEQQSKDEGEKESQTVVINVVENVANVDDTTDQNVSRKESNNRENYANDYPTKSNQLQNSNGLSPLRYNRRCGRNTGSRPLSGSSIASSTSSSGCSNQGVMPSAVNPYLASVESLADTCASSQGMYFNLIEFLHFFVTKLISSELVTSCLF